ncbi:MAG: iron-containing alcohol dehydrogenase [Bacteroidales bacterium]|nr:iron-containing alcohol dehydrogenase [Bacteroidales bacterium]
MEKFIMYNPVKLHFGRGVVSDLGDSISKYGKKVLLVYGGGSIRKNGIYEEIISQLGKAGAEVFEYAGIRPNPVIEDVDAAAGLGREKGVDVVLAVGGGSVIDSAKIISITIPVLHSGWDFIKGKSKPVCAIPLFAVLTLAATGTEMNRFAVVQNNLTKEKLGYGDLLTYPKESFLDPAYTLSVPADYTSYGITDLIAHCLEAYFGEGEATLSDRFVFSIIGEAMEYGPQLMHDTGNYLLREKIMYAATSALNNLTVYGRKNGDWGVHSIGHVLSVLYDVPHGASLSMVYPAWMRLHLDRAPERIAHLGMNLFGTTTAEETIEGFERFFTGIGSPVRLSQYGLDTPENRAEIFRTLKANRAGGNHFRLSDQDYENLIQLMA